MGRFFGLTVEAAMQYVRYLAWLAAKPKGQDKTRREAYGEDSVEEPPVVARWLLEAATECGLASSTGMGINPVSWTEVRSWAESMGWRGRWIRTTVRALSYAYVKEYREAEDPARHSPLVQDDVQGQRKAVMSQLKRFIQGRR